MKANRLGTGLFDVYDQQRNWYIETMKNIYKSIRKEKQLKWAKNTNSYIAKIKNQMIYKNKPNLITNQELKINTKRYNSSCLTIWQEFYSDTTKYYMNVEYKELS